MGRSRLRASAPHWAPSQDQRMDRWLGSHSATRLIPPSPCRQTRRQPQHQAMPQRARRQPKPQRPLSAGVGRAPGEVTKIMYVADPPRDEPGVPVLHFCGHQYPWVADTVTYSLVSWVCPLASLLPSVKPSEAMDMLSAGATMLDVRDNSEWNAGRVPGAVHVPAANVAAQAPKRLPKGRPVVVACRTGSRSKSATRILAGAGHRGLQPVRRFGRVGIGRRSSRR